MDFNQSQVRLLAGNLVPPQTHTIKQSRCYIHACDCAVAFRYSGVVLLRACVVALVRLHVVSHGVLLHAP